MELYFVCVSCGKLLIRGHNPETCPECGGNMVKGIEKPFSSLSFEDKQRIEGAKREWNNIKTKKMYYLKGAKK
jgi:rRNA maturation protein Nop10